MTAGRPATPIERKRSLGTLRNDRLPNQPIPMSQPTEPPEPPARLGEKGREFWELVYDQGGRWISHTTDRLLVTLAAEQVEEREQLRALVIASPEDHRLRAGLRDLEKALTSNLALMGFTPADRSRLGFAEIKRESKLEELMRRAEERRGDVG